VSYLILILIGYLLGALPFGLIAGRLFGGVDVRDHGSGNTGMANVVRTVSLPIGALVLFLDMGKAVLAVSLARLLADSPGVDTAVAIAVVIGHIWSVFMRFQGGKGTAVGWGALLVLSPISGAVATVAGLAAVGVWRYVSLGSLLGATIGSLTLVILAVIGFDPLPYALYGVIGTVLIILRHQDNIQRLIIGTEHKFGKFPESAPTQPTARRPKGLRWPKSV
jgi:glycerol-3-phosphate acyltransferase PlsY